MMNVVYKNVHDVIPYERNPRKNDAAVDYVAESIKQFGFKVPIIVDKDNVVVAGHTRLKAALKLGLDTVPCIVADDLTEEQVKAFRLADNRVAEFSNWDFDLLLDEMKEITDIDLKDLGFEEFLPDVEEPDGPVEEDDFDPVVLDEPDSMTGDIYVLGDHRLMCGDSTIHEDLEKLLNGEVIDLVYTDPPYNVNVHNSEDMTIANDNLAEDVFVEILKKAFQNLSDFMKEGCVFYCWHSDSERTNFQLAIEEYGLLVKQCLIWVKNGFNFGRQDYKWQHEPCLYGWKSGAGHYFVPEFNHPTVIEDKLDLNSMKKDDLKRLCEQLIAAHVPSSVFHENKPLKNDLHPTMKPIVMCGDMIHNSSRKGEIVCDAFGGSGSTLIACEQLGRKCRMMEIDPCYVDVIVKRYVHYMGTSKGCYLIRDGKQLELPQDVTTLLD